jgi:murein DD-endopeptidase MepM/ murein hydrolase activator NlpD
VTAADQPPPVVAPPPAATFVLQRAAVGPRLALFGGRPLAVRLRFRASGPLELKVHVRAPGGRIMRRLRFLAPPGFARVTWDGLTTRGHVAAAGRYRVYAGAVGGRLRRVGTFRWRLHVYPVRGAHSFRGAIGLFGAPRNGGRRHEGFDIDARCGTPVVAARGGRVRVRRFDPVLYGNLVIVRGARERRDYWYAHLRSPSPLRAGARVKTGDRIGRVGATGNARSVGCHLHFETRGPGGPFDPLPELRSWDRWS